MTRFLYASTMLAWALWLGGLIAMLMFVIQLFGVSHDLGVQAAPVLFRSFAMYQLIVGMIACASGTLLCLVTRRNAHAIMSLLMILSLAAALLIRKLTVQMLAIIAAGQSSSSDFLALHIKSNIAYTIAAGLLLIAGIGWAITSPVRRTPVGTSPAQDSPAGVGRQF